MYESIKKKPRRVARFWIPPAGKRELVVVGCSSSVISERGSGRAPVPRWVTPCRGRAGGAGTAAYVGPPLLRTPEPPLILEGRHAAALG